MTLELETDVLIIGGGMAGAWAALGARRAGASAILAEKGYCGSSGVTATAGPGHWWVPPEGRAEAVAKRFAQSGGLNEPAWMERVLAKTWESLPGLAGVYDFPKDEQGNPRFKALRGPEYMRALRRLAEEAGTRILDHAPALELLRHEDGSIGGAQGVLRSGEDWRISAGAVVLATGGTAFRSHLLGSRNNTGDGYLMAAEAGAELSGMEFTAVYCVAPARTTLTRSMSFAFATYYDEAGEVLPIWGPETTRPLARALMKGRVFCDLSRTPQDIRERVPTISPNFLLPFHRWGIDPYSQRFEVTLHGEGTIRGIGGVAVEGEDCRSSAPGLFVAGDAATRELAAGAISGGGAVNSSWALSSGQWAGAGAARHAALSRRRRGGRPIGRAGIRPEASGRRAPDPAEALAAVQEATLSYRRTLFRRGEDLAESLAGLDALWREVSASGSGLRARELAAMTASARWTTASALARAESRGLHLREDRPEADPAMARRLRSFGLDRVETRFEAAATTGVCA